MNLTVKAQSGAQQVEVADAIFGTAYNESLIHQIVTSFLAGGRSGTKAQKNRSDVSGGGIKPWRQKGTGRARSGSSRSPLWRTGGVTFAARPRNFTQKVNRKMYRAAMCSILSELVRQERLVIVDNITIDAPKTKKMLDWLAQHEFYDGLIIMSEFDDNVFLGTRNIPHVQITLSHYIDPVCLVAYDRILVTQAALKEIEESLMP
ncbi:MAG TPA: 50S ribosomal protein L4 [Gammaproteobacteria bacterium]|nr:50S ribosomal protein L4 [Gammaproteobacteria bacterium]